MLTFFLGIVSVLASWTEITEATGFFHLNLLWILAGIAGVFLAVNLFLFYFAWELMLVPMYFLISIWGHENRVYAAVKFFLFTQLSGLLMLIAILALFFLHYQATGTYTFEFGSGDVWIGAATVVQAIAEGRRSAYAVDAFLKGLDLGAIKTRQQLAEPQPEFLSIVPFTSERRSRATASRRWRPSSATRATSSTRSRTAARRSSPSRPAASSAPARRSASATCAGSGSSTARPSRRSSRRTTRAPASGRSRRTGSPGVNHDYIRDDSHAFILREPSRCIDCGRCAQVCSEVVGAACYDFMRIGFDTLVTTPLDMSLNDTPCVSCGRCAETCPTGALMPKPRVLQKYEVDESRCILCGICVDACPYDALRDGGDFELSHTSREDPMIDLIALASVDRRPR